jgi:hypothetical protein
MSSNRRRSKADIVLNQFFLHKTFAFLTLSLFQLFKNESSWEVLASCKIKWIKILMTFCYYFMKFWKKYLQLKCTRTDSVNEKRKKQKQVFNSKIWAILAQMPNHSACAKCLT